MANTFVTYCTTMFMMSSQIPNGMAAWQMISMAFGSALGFIGSIFFVVCFGLYVSVRVKSNTVALVVGFTGYLFWAFVSNIIIMIPVMIGARLFPMLGMQLMFYCRPIVSVAAAFIFLWRAKKTLRYYAFAK